MPRYFGTDGVRGVAFTELTVEMAEVLGAAAVQALGPRLLIGRDTRASGPALEAGLVAGITAAGGEALLLGIIPTPAIALLVGEYAADGGVVISASHNPPEYNGIKFFDALGYKLAEAVEDELEAALQAMPGSAAAAAGDAPASGGQPVPDANERYIARAVATLAGQGIDLKGLRIVVDCAHGAAYHTTPEALRRLGAEVIALNTDYDGSDINVDCGSTHLEQLREAVLAHSADIGFAHDGDADRVLAVDELGNEVDGDFIKAICASDLKAMAKLAGDTVVSTVMANLGFVRALQGMQVNVVQTDVGDSKVLAAMLEGGYTLGGEQSGHIIFLEHNTTGDGLISALQLLAAMRRAGRPLSELAKVMSKYPQVTINVQVADKQKVGGSERLAQAVAEAEAELAGEGRVLLRPSGTEPLYRVMVEASQADAAEAIASRLAELVAEIDSQ